MRASCCWTCLAAVGLIGCPPLAAADRSPDAGIGYAVVGMMGDVGDLAVHPSGLYAYVASNMGNVIQQFRIGTDGALADMTPPSAVAGSSPYAIVTTGTVQ